MKCKSTPATQHYTMLARNLVYAAVTRGKRLVVIVGQRKALAIAVRTQWLIAAVDEAAGMAISSPLKSTAMKTNIDLAVAGASAPLG